MDFFLALFMAVFLLLIVRSIAQFVENENSPVLTELALVTRKSRTHRHKGGTTYYIHCEVAGAQRKYRVPRWIYREIPEGVSGQLTHQGTRFLVFEYDGCRLEK